MIRSRESSDHWARRAALILDQARAGRGTPEDISWALSYLGDIDHPKKIPAHLYGSGRRTPAIAATT
jgi:hypothetical protein